MIHLFRAVPTGTELQALEDVLTSRWWGAGPKVEEFEKRFADYTGAKYAVAMNSCSSALDIAVQMLETPNELTVSAFTFVSSALAILHAGKRVRFVDIDPKSLCTDRADIQVLYAGNDYGQGRIYDMAHFGGGKHKGLISCWSFHAVKNLPTGAGGMLTTDNEYLANRARALSWCGIDKSTYTRSLRSYSWDYDIQEIGRNAAMNDLTAAIGLAQLEKLGENNLKREQVAGWYDQYLPIEIPRPFKSTTWHLYPIRVPERDLLYQRLAAAGIEAGVHYKPLYKYPIFPHTPLLETEKAFQQIISLPMHTELTEEDIKQVCQVIDQHLLQC